MLNEQQKNPWLVQFHPLQVSEDLQHNTTHFLQLTASPFEIEDYMHQLEQKTQILHEERTNGRV
jgi:hypothetical protein